MKPCFESDYERVYDVEASVLLEKDWTPFKIGDFLEDVAGRVWYLYDIILKVEMNPPHGVSIRLSGSTPTS